MRNMRSSATRENNRRLLDSEIDRLEKIAESVAAQVAFESKNNNKINKTLPKTYRTILNYSWDQTDKVIKIYISLSEFTEQVKAENVQIEVNNSTKSCTITVNTCRLVIANLFADIQVSGETCAVVTKSNLIVYLEKVEPGKWSSLQRKAIEKPLLPNKSDIDQDPSHGLMDMMKKMYDEGDDDMKRTIRKAWHDSSSKNMAGGEFDPDLNL